jgi:cytochrome c-type biogenesis protein CcmH
MTAFLLSAALLTLIVVAMLARPLLRAARRPADVDIAQLNASLLGEELDAVERDFATGQLSAAERDSARTDLTRRLLVDAAPEAQAAPARREGRGWPTLIAIALLLPLSGGLLYVLLGAPGALSDSAPAVDTAQSAPAGAASDAAVSTMVASLAARLAAHPDNPAGWAMLGRSYTVVGRYADAVAAFERIGPQLGQNAQWLAEEADAMAMAANGSPIGAPEKRARQALAIDPNNLLALMMAGYGAEARGDDAAALPLLQRAAAGVAPGSDDHNFLDGLIQKAQARLARSAPASAATPQSP